MNDDIDEWGPDEWGEPTEPETLPRSALKRNAGRDCDPGVKQDAKRNDQESHEQLQAVIGESLELLYNQLYDGA